MGAYTLYAVQIGTDVIAQIEDQRVDTAIEELLVSGDSNTRPEHVSVSRQRPSIRFTTSAITAVLDITGVGGVVIDEAESSNAAVLYFRQRAMGSAIAAGSSHLKMTVNLGFLYPATGRATHPDKATIDCVLECVFDSTNNPIVIAKNQADPGLSPTIDEIFTIGPWWVNGVGLGETIDNFTFNFGITTQNLEGSGSIWPTAKYVESQAPNMTCETTDLSILDQTAGLGLYGKPLAGVTRAFLRKKGPGDEVVADNVANHVRFDVAEGRLSSQGFGGAHQGQATATLLVTATYNNVNEPIAYAKDVVVSGS